MVVVVVVVLLSRARLVWWGRTMFDGMGSDGVGPQGWGVGWGVRGRRRAYLAEIDQAVSFKG